MNYDVNYFIDKFSKIPEKEWMVGDYTNVVQCCALGHCGHFFGAEFIAADKLFSSLREVISARPHERIIASINDGETKKYQQPTPKQRILAALHDIKKMQDDTWCNKEQSEPQPEKPKIEYRTVLVPETLSKQSKELIINN